MPDLVTHTAVAHLLRRSIDLKKYSRADSRLRVLFYLGTILPDILTRPWYILFPSTHDWTLPFHTPIGALLICALLALFFESRLQKRAFAWLASGTVLHFLLDGLQRQVVDNNLWLYPFSWKDFGYGFLWAGEIMRFIPVTLGLVVLLEIGMAFRRKADRAR